MNTMQVKFIDEDGSIHGGILVDDKYLICACCGGVFDLTEEHEEPFKILEKYNYWVDFSEGIIE